ncbi:hypothetical protein [Croceicoccus sp. Ery5]|uniref:hypothetical protein n=1 Tax=Croceicoccus sp. Ery5 TaxID=1703340 RepID=UPI001E3C908F|nr:hypothetical protein [Croceicoccus sp. Ery5]
MRAAACIVLLALCACSAEPDFDERFEKADAETRQLAQEIDGQLQEPANDRTEPAGAMARPAR